MIPLLGVIQDLHGLLLIAVTGCPLIQLVLGAAAEFQQLFPVLLEKVEDTGNGGVLLFLTLARSQTTHMDMELSLIHI